MSEYLSEARDLYMQAIEEKRAEIAKAETDERREGYWVKMTSKTELADLLIRIDAIDDWIRQREFATRQDARLEAESERLRIIREVAETQDQSLARIADALEAMKPQPVTIAEALKRSGVRSVDISAPSSGPLTHDGTGR